MRRAVLTGRPWSFDFSEQQLSLPMRRAASPNRAFARAGALARAHAEDYPWDIARLMAANGFLGIAIPEQHGGIGGQLMDAIIAIEQIAAADPRSADVIQAGNFGAIRVLAQFATPAQRERYLKIVAGR
ncbi:MAG: acyl-CoA dehydrogenase family protein [Rhodospirillales bacterium]